MNALEPLDHPFANSSPPSSPDLISAELMRRWGTALAVGVVGLSAGLLTIRLAGPDGSALSWLTVLVAAIAGLLLLLRHFEVSVALFLGVCWIAVGTPAIAQGGSGGGSQRLMLSQIGLLALLGLWSLKLLFRQRIDLYRAPVNVPILLYLGVSIWSTLNSLLFPNMVIAEDGPKQYVQVNLLEMAIRVLGLGGLLMIGNTLQGRLLRFAAVMVLLPGLLTFTGLLKFLPTSAFLAFPQILAMAVCAAVALSGWGTVWMRRLAGMVAVAIFGWYFLKGTEWVSGWLGAGIALALITYQAQRKLFWAGFVVVCALIVVNFSYFYEKIYTDNFYRGGKMTATANIEGAGAFENDRSRMLRGATLYARHFPLGIGLGNYRSYNRYFGRPDVWNTTTFTSAHGTYTQTLSETGWPGLITFLLLLCASGRMLLRFYKAMPEGTWQRTYFLGAWGGVVGVFVTSFNGDYLFPTYHNGGMTSFGACAYTWFMIGIGIAIARDQGLSWDELAGRKKPEDVTIAPIYGHGPFASLPSTAQGEG